MADLSPAIRQFLDAVAPGAFPKPPGPGPDLTDEAIIQRQLQQKQRLASMQGRSATFLTGPMGLGGPSSELATAFLRAKLDENPLGNLPTTDKTTLSPPPPGFAPRPKVPPGTPPGQSVPAGSFGAMGSLWKGI
jgi:hypothetical protein